jgi:hypothetical protein
LDSLSSPKTQVVQSRAAESPDDAAWEKIIANPAPRPKLEVFAAAAMAEEPSTPLEGNL